MTEKPKMVVFIHGAWQDSRVWHKVQSAYAGQACALDLPGHGKNKQDYSTITLSTYVDSVCDAVQPLLASQEVALVGHSMAGMVISEVAERIPVNALVYIAAFLPKPGESLLDIANGFKKAGLPPYMQFDLAQHSIALKKKGLENVLYHDCTAECARDAIAHLQTQAVLPFNGKARLGKQFETTPKHYILCSKDKAIRLEEQRKLASRYDCVEHLIESSHEPMVSMPDALASLISQIV